MLTRQILQADWPAPPNVRACVTTRTGGCSHRPYDSLNLGDHVGDEPRRVSQNRELLRVELQLPAEPCWLSQQHDRGVVAIDRRPGDFGEVTADAAVAHSANHVCVVLTADCLPVLVCDTDGTRVAAIHAGWRGLVAGVIPAALAALRPHGRNLIAWLGPCISQQAYEVDKPVRERILAACPQADAAFVPGRPGHWQADLAAVARTQLRSNGVGEVYGGDHCTYSDSQRFFSHRRDGETGRQAALIWLDG